MRQINRLILHSAETPISKDFSAIDIDKWHKERGFNEIGYHFVIKLTGELEFGRGVEQVGAHTFGFNNNSIGICLIGGVDNNGKRTDTRTPAQHRTLLGLVKMFKQIYPGIEVNGHYEFSDKKCPFFKVDEYK